MHGWSIEVLLKAHVSVEGAAPYIKDVPSVSEDRGRFDWWIMAIIVLLAMNVHVWLIDALGKKFWQYIGIY